MSEDSEPIVPEQESVAQLSHRRMLWTMAIVVIVGATASSIYLSARFGTGFLLGGILAFLNYFWLKNSLKKIFDSTAVGAEQRPSFISLNYFLRYLAVGLVIYIIYLSEFVSIIAVLLGMGAFAAAVMIEGLILIFSSISKREEI